MLNASHRARPRHWAGVVATVVSLTVAAVVGVPGAPAPSAEAAAVYSLGAFPLQAPCRMLRNFGDSRDGGTRIHEGEDIVPLASSTGWAPQTGHAVRAALGGTVRQVWRDTGLSYGAGNGLQITHANGTYTRYFHLASFASVAQVGASVSAGQIIGTAGDTGTSNGNYHLHFELHPYGGAAVDPAPSLDAIGGCGSTSTTVTPRTTGTITHTLSIGSPYHDEVRILQNRLNQLGSHLVADGSFGALTKQAVVAFQSAHGLVADGIVGPITGHALGVR